MEGYLVFLTNRSDLSLGLFLNSYYQLWYKAQSFTGQKATVPMPSAFEERVMHPPCLESQPAYSCLE